MRSNVIDLELFIHHRTDRAIMVSDDGEKDGAVWLPLSQIEVEMNVVGETDTITLPEWLAKERGLI